MKDYCKCCICGKSTIKGGFWNGWTDKEYCNSCAKIHGYDGEPTIREDGQMLLDVEDEDQ